LVAWQKAFDLYLDIYRATVGFPRDELYGLVSQLRRSALSVPSNIAEGHGRNTTGEFLQHLGNARGSLFEAETQLLAAMKLEYLPEGSAAALLEKAAETGRVLNGLMNSLK
jgi:four helix bundle protein